MDLAGFLALFHQMFPTFPSGIIILVALIALVLGWLVISRKKGGQHLEISVRSGPDTSKPVSQEPVSPPQSAALPTPSISVKTEANPSISQHISVQVVPPPPQPAPAPYYPGEAKLPIPTPSETVSEQSTPPINPSDDEASEAQRDGVQSAPNAIGTSVQNDLDVLPRVELHQLAAPSVLDAPHQEPIEMQRSESPLNETLDTQSDSEPRADSPETPSDEQRLQIDATIPASQPPAEPARATPSGRLYSQLQRTDAQTALRRMSLITQRTYAYARANRRDSVAQKPFANELLSIRLLHDYVTYVRHHLNRLNQSLNRLGITLDDPTQDPRWVLSAFLDPFSDVDVERSPTAMREAMVDTAQSMAEAIEAKGFPYKAERRWGANGALFYSLDDKGVQSTSVDEVDFTDFDIDEADIDMDDGEEDGEP